jgi:hypothetical protein
MIFTNKKQNKKNTDANKVETRKSVFTLGSVGLNTAGTLLQS